MELWKSEEGTEIFIYVQIAQFKAIRIFFCQYNYTKNAGKWCREFVERGYLQKDDMVGMLGEFKWSLLTSAIFTDLFSEEVSK